MRLKTILPVLVVLVAVAGAIGLLATRETPTPKPAERRHPSVRVFRALPESIALSVRSQGTIMPRTESQLIAEVSGPVVWTAQSLASGGYFRAGDPLVKIDPSRFETTVERAQASLGRAKGEYEYAQALLRRQEQLAADEIVSINLFEDAQRAKSVTEANVQDAEAALDEALRDVKRTVIRAPFRGRVRDESVDVGQFVTVGSPFATLYATDFFEVRLPVPDDELAYLDAPLWEEEHKELPKVRLYTEFAGAERSWWGQVVRTEGEIDAKSRMVHVIARVENPRATAIASAGADAGIPIPVGLFVHAEIDAQAVTDAYVLPRAVLWDGTHVVIADEENRLRRREVTVLRVDRDEVIITAGLEPGERVCAVPPADLIEGQMVNPYGEGPIVDDSGGADS